MTVKTPDFMRNSPMLVERWRLRRREAVEMLALAVHQEKMDGPQLEELAIVIHKIAGTAGLFGEAALGNQAAELDRALRQSASIEEKLRLAREMLAVA